MQEQGLEAEMRRLLAIEEVANDPRVADVVWLAEVMGQSPLTHDEELNLSRALATEYGVTTQDVMTAAELCEKRIRSQLL